MRAGLNLKAEIIRISYGDDDAVGGAVVTGTCVYEGLNVAISQRRPSQVSLEQGLEVANIFDFTCRAKDVTLFERDEVRVTWPLDHPYYNLCFRIMGVQLPRGRTRYRNQHATLSRIEDSRSRQ